MVKTTMAEAKKLAKELKINTNKIPLKEFHKGIVVELEHGPKSKGGISNKTNVTKGSLSKTAKIAEAHLLESKNYYKELAKMEKKMERSKNAMENRKKNKKGMADTKKRRK